jgi:pimeloyl-ACP methyl ester carboxylesterase
MPEIGDELVADTPGSGVAERSVDADGVRIRYLEAGRGQPLVCVHGTGALRLDPAHALLAQRFRVMVFGASGSGESPAPLRSRSMADRLALAAAALGLARYNLMGTASGGAIALWLAVQHPARVHALVLTSPEAIRPDGHPGPGGPAQRLPDSPNAERHPLVEAAAFVPSEQHALAGSERDAELAGRLAGLQVPTLVLFGTADRVIPPEMGRVYRATLPSCHFVLVYGAGHAIAADRPQAVASLVGDFLERREQFVVSRARGLMYP